MLSQERSRPLLESHYRKPGLGLSELDKSSRFPDGLRRDAIDELQRSQEQLRARATALQGPSDGLPGTASHRVPRGHTFRPW